MKYYQMKIELEMPDDYKMEDVKKAMDEKIASHDSKFVSTIRGSAKTRFDRAKMFAEHKK